VRALVLGGSVFVGRRLVAALVDAGHHVAVLNRGKTSVDLPDGVDRLMADRTDPSSMRAALAGTEWDAVFDVSGFVMAAGGSDIDGLLDLLAGRVGHYVFVSSIMAYDQSMVGVFPWTEDQPTNPEGPGSYGGFKAVAEASMMARGASGFPATVVRPAAIYGPENNIFDMETALFVRLLQRRPILVPHGGLVAGSYGHVDDLCAAMIDIVGRSSTHGEVLNITTDGVSVNRYIEVLADVAGVEPDVVQIPDEALATLPGPIFGHLFGVRHHAVLSTDKAARLLGVTPRYDLRSGHRQTFEWFLAQGWADRVEPLVDPVWRATWNFAAEDAALQALGVRR
jgi:nucleoside-diphosphate-sugar epimerase